MLFEDIVGSRFFPGYGRKPGIRSPFEGLKFPATAKKFPVSQAREIGLQRPDLLYNRQAIRRPDGVLCGIPGSLAYREFRGAS
jgi:hypothetical protein